MSLKNLNHLKIAATADFHVRDAAGELQYDDEGNPLTITLYSPGTKQALRAKHNLDERNSTRVTNRMMGTPDARLSAEEKVKEDAEYLAAITVSFNGFGVDDLRGHELFKAVYGDIELIHIKNDVLKFHSREANFMKPSTGG